MAAVGGDGSVRGALTPHHRRFLLLHAFLVAAVVNAALSALIAWLFTFSEDEIPLWAVPLIGGPSVGVDTIATFFVLPFLTTLVITTVVWKEMEHERLPPMDLPRGSRLEKLPDTRLRRAAWIGLICMLIFGPLSAVVLSALDFGDISVGDFVLYKAIFGVVLGAIVTPPIAIVAMSDPPEVRAHAAATAPATSGP
jgi:hypothetical protein